MTKSQITKAIGACSTLYCPLSDLRHVVLFSCINDKCSVNAISSVTFHKQVRNLCYNLDYWIYKVASNRAREMK